MEIIIERENRFAFQYQHFLCQQSFSVIYNKVYYTTFFLAVRGLLLHFYVCNLCKGPFQQHHISPFPPLKKTFLCNNISLPNIPNMHKGLSSSKITWSNCMVWLRIPSFDHDRQFTVNPQGQQELLCNIHSWVQRKLSPLSPLNILLLINGPLISFGFNGIND